MTLRVIPEQVVEGRRLGRQLHHDPRSKQYRLRATAQGELVDTDWAPGIPCTDQGNIGECVGEATTEQLSADLFRGIVPLSQLNEKFSRQFYSDCTYADPYAGAWNVDGTGQDTGTDGVTAAKVCVKRGYASGYQHIMDMASLLAVTQKRGSILGIQWKSGCDEPNSQGLIRYTGAVRGGHELYVRGYHVGRQWFRLQNHWTAAWGDKGTCWISLADLTAALNDDGDVTVIIPATAPAPAPTPTPSPVDVDADLAKAFKAWRPGIISKITKAAGLARAGDAWCERHGY